VTLIEVLVTVVISAIAMMALAMPVVAERRFWTIGIQQTQVQRDAQVALRAIAKVARQSSKVDVKNVGPDHGKVEFGYTGCGKHVFEGGSDVGDALPKGWLKADRCGVSSALINPSVDRGGSRVTRLEFSEVEQDRLQVSPPPGIVNGVEMISGIGG
jgi:type II secretory pathway pseudopilin PulG